MATPSGLTIDPLLATGDGALGFWKALPQVFPKTRQQRCWVALSYFPFS
jgi:transposase-like protein